MKSPKIDDLIILRNDIYYCYLMSIRYPNLPDLREKISEEEVQKNLIILKEKRPTKPEKLVKLFQLLEQTDELLRNSKSISQDDLDQIYKEIINKYANLNFKTTQGITDLTLNRRLNGTLGIKKRYKENKLYEKRAFFFDLMRTITQEAGKKWPNPNAAIELNLKRIEKEFAIFNKNWIQDKIVGHQNDLNSLKQKYMVKVQVGIEQSIDLSGTLILKPEFKIQFDEKGWRNESRDIDKRIKDLELALMPTFEGVKKLSQLLPYTTSDKARVLIRLLRENKQLMDDIILPSHFT